MYIEAIKQHLKTQSAIMDLKVIARTAGYEVHVIIPQNSIYVNDDYFKVLTVSNFAQYAKVVLYINDADCAKLAASILPATETEQNS